MTAKKDSCAHWYVLDALPVDGRVHGRCKHCGAPESWPSYTPSTYNMRTAPYSDVKVDRERAEFAMADEVVR
jgi:hypothetical protein